MYKGFAFSIALLLLLASNTFADVAQIQTHYVNSINEGLIGGNSSASMASFTVTPVANFQFAEDGGGNAKYLQVSNSALVQAAGAVGVYGDYGYENSANVSGSQTQASTEGYNSLGTQNQSTAALFSQNTVSNGSFGSAVVAQNYIGTGGQMVSTPYGINVNFMAVGVDANAGMLVNRSLSINRLGI